ncbi:unnamed protein product [Clonostachys rosea]|uniref:Uncharacterized protein n=1 Tax=Bionectria ochroleuca TaxID=29856 RepID=A0ABY6UYF5_BIOOC|nr:unnamed protein product [Clonostachys rosea]
MEGQSSDWEEVSGSSVFWILLTLGIAASTLPSARSKLLCGHIFGTSIDPLRSMPWVCLLDAMFDLFIIVEAIRHRMSKAEESEKRAEETTPTEPNLIMVKLVMTILAVLPPTVKILSMRGIPVSQVCAFVFFFAIATSLVVDLWIPSAQKSDPTRTEYVDDKKGQTAIACLGLAAFLAYTGMVISELWIWYNIGCLSSEHSYIFKEINFWVTFACSLGFSMQLLIWVIYFIISSHRFSIPSYPRVFPVFGIFMVFFILTGLAKSPIHEKPSTGRITSPPPWLKQFSYSTSLMFCTAIVSYMAVMLCHALGLLIIRTCGIVQQPSGQDEESGTDQPASAAQFGKPEIAQEQDGAAGSKFGRAMSSVVSVIRSLPTLGRRVDSWLWGFFDLPSAVSLAAFLTIFNLIRTVWYYLVVFDGSGTSTPAWNSVLG